MFKIGIFETTAPKKLIGRIITPGFEIDDVLILGDFQAEQSDAPSHRLQKNGCDLGSGWTRIAKSGERYQAIEIDGPMLTRPLSAGLFSNNDGRSFRLVWSSPQEQAMLRREWREENYGTR